MPALGCVCNTCSVCRVRTRELRKTIRRRESEGAIPDPLRREMGRARYVATPTATKRERNQLTPEQKQRRSAARKKRGVKKRKAPIDFFIDGEGHGRAPHVYTYLAAVSLDGTTYDIRNPSGLTTAEILLFLTDTLPNRARLWGFSLGYDKTKWLADIPRDSLALLYHPEHRRKKDDKGVRDIAWSSFRLNMQSTKFTVSHIEKGRRRKNWERRTVWDCFKYFQCSFVKAIETWQVVTPEELEFIKLMKDSRSGFTPENSDEIERYCRLECQIGARLIHALLTAHADIGLETTVFYGPGSTADALLELHHVADYMAQCPEWAVKAVMTAFSGGRFENLLFGVVPGPLYGWDLSSAYPYQAYQLPCLQCGVWEYHEGTLEEMLPAIRAATLACTHTYVPKHDPMLAYAPFAFRDHKGHIFYPFDCATWVWKQELLAGLNAKIWDIEATESITYTTRCDHRPFEWVPKTYQDRLNLGKDGKGLVLKLALNSGTYGKFAQSVGKAKFNNWVWAGVVTSGCRAQILDAMAAAPRLEDIISIATDGIISTCRLDLATPLPTNTGTKKPLGGWEDKSKDKNGKPIPPHELRGRVLVRPGLNTAWPVKDDDEEDTRARGVGRSVFTKAIKEIVAAIESGQPGYTIRDIPRFVGHKSSIRPNGNARRLLPMLSRYPYLRALLKPEHFSQRADCGEWILDEHILSFDPIPKRIRGEGNRLLVRSMNGAESRPYDKGRIDPVSESYREQQDIAEEQP